MHRKVSINCIALANFRRYLQNHDFFFTTASVCHCGTGLCFYTNTKNLCEITLSCFSRAYRLYTLTRRSNQLSYTLHVWVFLRAFINFVNGNFLRSKAKIEKAICFVHSITLTFIIYILEITILSKASMARRRALNRRV